MILISLENVIFEGRDDPVMEACWGMVVWAMVAIFVWSLA